MKRKIYSELLKWKKENKGEVALLIDGARRIGKSYIVEQFAKENYKSYILIDFNKVGKDIKDLFENYLDKLDIEIRKRIGFEKNKGSFLRLKNRFISECNNAKGIFAIRKIYKDSLRYLKTIPINKPKDCLKVGIIGELYTAMEPYSNYELEKTLASYHIEIKRFTNISYLLWQKKFLLPFMKFRIRKYCKYTLGADGLDNVYRINYLKRHHFDGVIHTKPTGCTPEIGAIPIMIKEAKDLNIPITFFSFDEQSGLDGIKTRLEAFYDLLNFKREG